MNANAAAILLATYWCINRMHVHRPSIAATVVPCLPRLKNQPLCWQVTAAKAVCRCPSRTSLARPLPSLCFDRPPSPIFCALSIFPAPSLFRRLLLPHLALRPVPCLDRRGTTNPPFWLRPLHASPPSLHLALLRANASHLSRRTGNGILIAIVAPVAGVIRNRSFVSRVSSSWLPDTSERIVLMPHCLSFPPRVDVSEY